MEAAAAAAGETEATIEASVMTCWSEWRQSGESSRWSHPESLVGRSRWVTWRRRWVTWETKLTASRGWKKIIIYEDAGG